MFKIAFLDNRFGAAPLQLLAALSPVTSKGCEREQGAERGRRGEGREINFVVPWMFAARAAYATWLTSFHELKVSASRCGLRYRADYYSRARLNKKERAEETDLREQGREGHKGEGRKEERGQRAERKS
ncbi:hypothetical protein DBV15_06358 [Temnothorax longispinosus]|uniref:Uncharacterized protein n=1 Tax=Temnothorax longispinosus TaxID=300112 RepID=A0A4S2L7I3_9HYME|nr:hypothetical protein DBV15_06358 [Temnothorax longispinosus]